MDANRHSAAGTVAGFAYQFERALNWLAQKEAGASIGIETADDVAVLSSDASLVLEQDKHSISEAATQPFSDRSKGLWNTLAMWIEAIESKQRPIESTTFLLVTNKVVPECIARHIARARSDEEIDTCIKELKKVGTAPPEHIAKLVKQVLCSQARTTLRAVISRVQLADGSDGTATVGLRKSTIAHLQLPNWCLPHSDSIVNELLGWLHQTAMLAWQHKQPAWVERNYFVNQLHAILDSRKRQITRERAEFLIPVTDEKVGREKSRPFVSQLHLITDDDTVVDTAIREYIRCNIEKSRLCKEGNITDDDWKAFEGMLVSRWTKIRSRISRIKSGVAERDVGFEIFTETTEGYKETLAGSNTEQVYLTSGTYHRLADLLTVGWHPEFEALMRKLFGEQ